MKTELGSHSPLIARCSNSTRIPKILHYTFGMARNQGLKPWSLIHHVCLRSAIERIKPERVCLYYEYEPTGPWWELSRSLVEVIKIRAPREIFGRPLLHYAHRSDVVRLQTLVEYGGIYLDADVLVQRSFDELLIHSTVLGSEGEGAEIGLANSVILAEPNAPFIVRWLEEYRHFRGEGRDKYWSEHSIQVPAKLAAFYPSDITVLPYTAFQWPLWTKEHIEWMFGSSKSIPLDGTYANHLWESAAEKFIENLTPGQVRAHDSNFHFWARPFVADLPDDFGASTAGQHLLRLKDKALRKGCVVNRWCKSRIDAIHRRTSGLMINEQHFRRRAFQNVYKRSLWGRNGTSRFFSGLGSVGSVAEFYVDRMGELLELHRQELGRPLTLVDIGCGDFRVGRALVDKVPDLTYVGCDIVPELIAFNRSTYADNRISFQCVDAVCDILPEGDVCLIRQVFQHLSNADILRVLNRVQYPIVYVTEAHPPERLGPVNPDKTAGSDVRFNWRTGRGRGVELNQPPYALSTHEMFRVPNPPNEILITERISFPRMDPRTPAYPPDRYERL